MSRNRKRGIFYRRRKRKGRVENVECGSLSQALEHAFYDSAYDLADPLEILVEGDRISIKKAKAFMRGKTVPQ